MSIFIEEIELDDILKPYDIDKPLTKLEAALLNKLEFAGLSLTDISEIEQWANKASQQQDYLTAKTAFELMLRACISEGADKDNFDVLDSLTGIAESWLKLGNLKQALPFYQFVYETRSSAWGEQNVDTINSLEQFAICLSQLGRFKKALPFYKKIYKFRQLLLGTENQDTLGSLDNLANCLVDLGFHQDALPLFQKVYKTRQKLFGNKHLNTLQSCNNLSRCLFHLGRIAESQTLWQKAYQTSQELFGNEDDVTLNCLNNIAACMDDLGQNQEALPLHQQAYHTRKTLLGLQHPDTLYSLDNIAVCLSKLKRLNEALPLFEQAYNTRKNVLGRQHIETLNSLYNSGACLYELGQFELALQKFQKAYEIRKTVLGEQHLDTLMSLYMLSICLEDEEDIEKIVSLFKQISNLLATTPMRYGKWTYITAMLANKIEKLAPLDYRTNTDWVKQLRPLSHAFIEALDLQPESFLQQARLNFLIFHSAYLQFCLYEQEKVIPEIFAAIQGRKIAAFFLDELQYSSKNDTNQQRFFEVRTELRQQSLISDKKKFQNYQVLFDEYHSLRLELEKTTVFVNPHIDLKKLQSHLVYQEAILLLIDLTSLSIQWMDEFEQIAFLITRNNYHLIPLVEIPNFATMTQNSDFSSLRETMENFIWQPISDKLESIKYLHIVTHGKLHILPYELGHPEGIKINNYPGLVFYQQLHHHKISFPIGKPSTTALLDIHVEAAENHEQPIPLVNAEKQMIEAIWGNSVVPLIETKEIKYLHLAGHGFQDLDNPANAKLLIAPDKFMNLQSILHSNLRPRVVFISACVVGRISEDIDGEPLGLVSAFFMRGAEYVIASLIPVPDFYMPLLAVLFHQAWQQGYNPDTALAEAKRRLKQGEWYENTETLVRESYYPILIRIFKNIAKTRNRRVWQALQEVWPIPAKYDRHGSAKINNFLSKLRQNEYCNQLVDDILDYMFSHKAELDMGEFYNWVRGFGCVKK